MPSGSNLILTKAEKQLIELVRSLDYGEVRIVVKDNKPIRVEEIRRSIQLTKVLIDFAYIGKCKKQELQQMLLQLLFDGPEW